jgi:hypothetical protein
MSFFLALALIASGLHGVVTRGPIQPVCQVGKPCTAPAVGAVLVFSHSGTGTLAARVRAGTGGRYAVHLAPGFYAVRVSPSLKVGSGLRPREVRVRAGVFGRLDFAIDTGIR